MSSSLNRKLFKFIDFRFMFQAPDGQVNGVSCVCVFVCVYVFVCFSLKAVSCVEFNLIQSRDRYLRYACAPAHGDKYINAFNDQLQHI